MLLRKIKGLFSVEEKMYMKYMLDSVNWIRQTVDKLYIKGYTLGYMHIADILSPIDGEFSTTQVIAISRYMDVMNYYESNEIHDFKWQTLFSELMHKKREMTNEELEISYLYFEKIIKSMDEYGIIPSLGYVRVNKEPMLACDGTHRLGYYLYHKYFYVPCVFQRKVCEDDVVDYKNTKMWLSDIGMSNEDINVIYKMLKRIWNSVSRPLVGIVAKDVWDNYTELKNKILEYGEIKQLKEVVCGDLINHNRNSVFLLYKTFGIKSEKLPCYIVHFELNKQHLYNDNKRIRSKYVDEIERIGEKSGKHWGRIGHSITESVLLEQYLKSDLKAKI